MNTTIEKKQTTTLDKKAAMVDTTRNMEHSAPSDSRTSFEDGVLQTATENFREAIKSVDVERTELVKNAIDNIKPGRTFDSSVVRQINKLETKRNRLIVAHFAWLLKKNPAYVHAIVHQIIEL